MAGWYSCPKCRALKMLIGDDEKKCPICTVGLVMWPGRLRSPPVLGTAQRFPPKSYRNAMSAITSAFADNGHSPA